MLKKTKCLVDNNSKKFTIVDEAKLLGTYITSDFKEGCKAGSKEG